jgi:hypothetical protein
MSLSAMLLSGEVFITTTLVLIFLYISWLRSIDWAIPLERPVTTNMLQDKPDTGYEKMWEAREDDLYLVQDISQQTLPARAQALGQPGSFRLSLCDFLVYENCNCALLLCSGRLIPGHRSSAVK